MKKYLLFILSYLIFTSSLLSQGFAGINTGNYAGISGVMLQPASIVDSRFKFDLNLFSTDARYSNNYFLLDRNVLLKFNKSNFDDYSTFRSKYLTEATLSAGEKAFFNISNRTQLPLSFMMTLNEKSAFAFNLQSRSIMQGRNISQDLAKLAFNSFYYQPFNNQELDASGVTLQSLSWVEAGLTYGRVLLSNGNHFLKGAVTAKYLGGVSSLQLSANNLAVRVNADSTFDFTADRVNYDHNKNADLNRVIDSRFRPDANAIGFDAGLVYEYRGHLNNVKYIRNDDEKSYEVKRRDLNKYIFKLGVSLLDAGMLRFTKADNVNSFRANITNWDIRNSNYASLKEFDTALGNRVTPLTNDPLDYNVYLPGALSVQLDVRFVKGLYLNATAYRPLKLGSEAGTRFNNYGYYSITPRYERRHFGIYVPYTFSDKEDISRYRDNWLGLTLRLGPVFLGSSNLGSMAFNQKIKAADFFVGLKIGFTYGKPSKLKRLFAGQKEPGNETLLHKKENEEKEAVTSRRLLNQEVDKTPRSGDTSVNTRMVVDYSKGQIYSVGKPGQIIVVNNHYYYGYVPMEGKPSISNEQRLQLIPAQRDSYKVDSAVSINFLQKKRADSLNKELNDSLMQKREQLDSLIIRLYNLRQRLDSSTRQDNSSGLIHQQSGNPGKLQDINDNGKTTRNQNLNSENNLETVMLSKDTVQLNTAQTTQNENAKKKERALNENEQQKATSNSQLIPVSDTEMNVDTNARRYPWHQIRGDHAYKTYMEQSERMQADIERLEREIANNRTHSNNSATQPNYSPTFQYTGPPSTGFYPTNVLERDTIVIRDTFFVTKTDTITKNLWRTPTQAIAPVPKEKIVEEKIKYKMLPPENILFATGQAAIRQVYVSKLAYLADMLRQDSALKITITGHTDKTGSTAINEHLSWKRANAVKLFFLREGISENRMQVIAVASEDPIVDGNTNNAKMQNRRVEIKMVQ